MSYDLELVRKDFPILDRMIGKYPLAYLDSANTSQKPRQVIEAVDNHYRMHNANISRAMHQLGAESTMAYEQARTKVADFICATRSEEIIFTKNASEALNMAAHILTADLKEGDEIVVSVMEHHSNLVPWQLAAERTGARLRWFDITEDGHLDLARAEAEGLINERTKIVSLTWASNVLGTINPIAHIAAQAHSVGALMVVDASQAVPGRPCEVSALGADLVAFTGHKMCAPTGIGVLWGRYDLLASLPPFLGGGEMISVVTMEKSTYANPPYRFEAGTQPIAQAVGLAAAIDYLSDLGMESIEAHDRAMTAAMIEGLSALGSVKIIGPLDDADRASAVAFTVEGVHPHDVMQLLDSRGVAVRGGHHCAAPLHKRLGIQSSSRASAYLYTSMQEIEALVDAVDWAHRFFTGKMRRS